MDVFSRPFIKGVLNVYLHCLLRMQSWLVGCGTRDACLRCVNEKWVPQIPKLFPQMFRMKTVHTSGTFFENVPNNVEHFFNHVTI